jgi:hypothetical protein
VFSRRHKPVNTHLPELVSPSLHRRKTAAAAEELDVENQEEVDVENQEEAVVENLATEEVAVASLRLPSLISYRSESMTIEQPHLGPAAVPKLHHLDDAAHWMASIFLN